VRKRIAMAVISAALPLMAFMAQAQALAAPLRIYGTVVSFNGDKLTMKTETGDSVSIAVPADTRIISIRLGRLEDIKPGDFVGSAAVSGSDGKLHAQEVHIFPEAMRGAGEGHRAMGPDASRSMTNGTVLAGQERTMTNGTVSGSVGAGKARTIQISYKGGVQEIEVGPDVPIRYFVVGSSQLLVPGATVSVTAIQKDGAPVATNIQAEKDGVKPPHP
jgi:hypothetical protein